MMGPNVSPLSIVARSSRDKEKLANGHSKCRLDEQEKLGPITRYKKMVITYKRTGHWLGGPNGPAHRRWTRLGAFKSTAFIYALIALFALIMSVQNLADCKETTTTTTSSPTKKGDVEKFLAAMKKSVGDDDHDDDHPDHVEDKDDGFKSRAAPVTTTGAPKKTTTTKSTPSKSPSKKPSSSSKRPKSSQKPKGNKKPGSSKKPKSTKSPSTSVRPPAKSTTKRTADKTKEMKKTKMENATKNAAEAESKAKSSKPVDLKLEAALKKLTAKGKRVEAKKNRTIIINGRKFDQVNPIECVDEQFYSLLMKDLSLINPSMTRDEYETYYDSERAKAINAIVDTPVVAKKKKTSAIAKQMAAAAGQRSGAEGAQGGSRAGEILEIEKSMTSQKLLSEIRRFWQETNRTYVLTANKLNLRFSRRKRAAKKSESQTKKPTPTTTGKPKTAGKPTTKTTTSQNSTTAKPIAKQSPPKPPAPPSNTTIKPVIKEPNYRQALENHYYLMKRLQELKTMLVNGEETIIILNNRVKKLQQAVGEDELHQALCSCITTRGGRAAQMLISELFTDKNALKMLTQLKEARRKAEDAARDTAEFCSYWYGDTLRAQATKKEKQIKRLIMSLKNQIIRKTIKTTNKTTTTTVQIVRQGNVTKRVVHRKTKIRVVTKVVEMTRLWKPELSNWIQKQLGGNFSMASFNSSQLLADLAKSRPKRRAQMNPEPDWFMSSPFDQASLYTDVEDGEDLETSSILESFIANNYQPLALARRRRQAAKGTGKPSSGGSSTKPPRKHYPTKGVGLGPASKRGSSTKRPTQKAQAKQTSRKPPSPTKGLKVTKSSTTRKPVAAASNATKKPLSFEERTTRSAGKCAVDGFSLLLDIAYDQNAILYETNRIKRNHRYIKTLRNVYVSSFSKYWVEKRDEWSRRFAAQTIELNKLKTRIQTKTTRRKTTTTTQTKPKQSRAPDNPAGNKGKGGGSNSANKTKTKTTTPIPSGGKKGDQKATISPALDQFDKENFIKKQNSTNHSPGGKEQAEQLANSTKILNQDIGVRSSDKSVDELIDDALEPTGDAYERGARLGYTIGKFIGDKAARQWPDPMELNTFTYDSLFLPGVGHGYNVEQTKELEKLIVTETAKRVAFTEANRKTFAKALHTAYLNGAFIVPKFGVLHGQRAVAKRAATEGAQIGYEAASKAAAEFAPLAMKFFHLHEHQRALAAPYKELGNKWVSSKAQQKSLMERIDQLERESELQANITRTTLECGQKTGALMGALMGLLVVPEAFETYARVRGSLEAVESEFYRYKLGALRGYELGESWALLNYTNAMAKRLDSFRADIGKVDLPPRANKSKATTTTTTTTKPPKSNKSKNKNITHIPDDNLMRTVADTDPYYTNVNNIFQYMVVNYGQNMVANHTRGSMLVTRSLVPIDDQVLSSMKAQSGDLVATSQERSNNDDDEDDILTTVKVVGELGGSLSTAGKKGKKIPVKLEIIDLGPMIEFADESPKKKTPQNNDTGLLEAIPLTEALSQVNKIYVKLRVAKREDAALETEDELEAYLNADQADAGDGFICGSYSLLGASRKGNTQSSSSSAGNTPRETHDDLSLESAILDELFNRIENMPSGNDAVAFTEQVMRMTTVAPSRATPIKTTSGKPAKSTTVKAGGTKPSPGLSSKQTKTSTAPSHPKPVKPKKSTPKVTTTTSSPKASSTTSKNQPKTRSGLNDEKTTPKAAAPDASTTTTAGPDRKSQLSSTEPPSVKDEGTTTPKTNAQVATPTTSEPGPKEEEVKTRSSLDDDDQMTPKDKGQDETAPTTGAPGDKTQPKPRSSLVGDDTDSNDD